MYKKIILFLTIIFINGVYGFEDSDIDGVEDNADACPNTPFDALVDARGCSPNQTPSIKEEEDIKGTITFKVGYTSIRDKKYDDTNYFDIYGNYSYKSWDISISNLQSTNVIKDDSNSGNNIYFSIGYSIDYPEAQAQISIGTKINNKNNSKNYSKKSSLSNDRDNDYFVGINYEHFFNNNFTLFFYYGYTISGDSHKYDYGDYSSFYVGTGYQFTDNFYGTISYNHTDSIYENRDGENHIIVYGSLDFTKDIFATISYGYGLNDYSYDNTISTALGFRF